MRRSGNGGGGGGGTLGGSSAASVLQRHATGFGQSRATHSVDRTWRLTGLLPTAAVIKDARILPALRKDFARAVAAATAPGGEAVSLEAYAARLAEAVRLFRETRESLLAVLGACLASSLASVEAVAETAARAPTDIVPDAVRAATARSMTASDLVAHVYAGLHAKAMGVAVCAVGGEAGEVVRLLARCRAFIAQLEGRLQHLEDMAAPRDEERVAAGWPHPHHASGSGGSEVGGPAPRGGGGGGGRPRRGSVASSAGVTAPGSARGDINPIALAAMALADEDARLAAGHISRAWESMWMARAAAAAAAAALGAAAATHDPVAIMLGDGGDGGGGATPAVGDDDSPGRRASNKSRGGGGGGDTMVTVRALGGVRSSSLRRGDAADNPALSPGSPLLSSSAAPIFPFTGRDPPFAASEPGMLPGTALPSDALEFMRYPHAYGALVSTPIPAVPPVAAEDQHLSAEALASGGDMMSAMVMEHNVTPAVATAVLRPLVWLLWRHTLLLYAHATRGRAAEGTRDMWTTLLTSRTLARAASMSAAADAFAVRKAAIVPAARRGAAPPRHPDHPEPPPPPPASHEDLDHGSTARRTLDAHLGMVLYRFLEAAALPHVFPIA